MGGATVTFDRFGSPLELIHIAVGFLASIRGYYVTALQQVPTCLCAAGIQARRDIKYLSCAWEARTVKVTYIAKVISKTEIYTRLS